MYIKVIVLLFNFTHCGSFDVKKKFGTHMAIGESLQKSLAANKIAEEDK